MRKNVSALCVLSAVAAASPSLAAPPQSVITERGSAEQNFSNRGPVPSSWKFDNAGRLLSIPGSLEVTYDAAGRVVKALLHEQGVANDGSGDLIKIETVFTVTPSLTESGFDVHEIATRDRRGELVVITDSMRSGISKFVIEASFHRVAENGDKVDISTDDAFKTDPSFVLGSIHIVHRFERWIPMFCGATYQAAIRF